MQPPQHVEQHLLQPRLQRSGDVLVPLADLFLRLPRRPQFPRQPLRPERADPRRPFRPRHVDAVPLVAEVLEPQAESLLRVRANDLAEQVEELRLPVRRQPHHLVLVAVSVEPQVLGDGGVEKAQRMRKRHLAVHVDAVPAAGAPHAAGEVAQPVQRKQRRLLERRDEEARREVGAMVLDEDGRGDPGPVSDAPLDEGRDVAEALPGGGALDGQPRLAHRPENLPEDAGAAGAGDDGNELRVVRGDVADILDGRSGKPSRVLHTVEALLLRRQHGSTGVDNGSSRIGVVGRYSQEICTLTHSVDRLVDQLRLSVGTLG